MIRGELSCLATGLNFYYVPHRMGGGHIVFGADPVDVSAGVTLPCLHDIS